MTSFYRLKTGTAALMAMAITTTATIPLLTLAPASAQRVFGQSNRVSIPSGVTIPLTHDKDKIVVTPTETVSLTLKVATNIIDNNRNVLIPRGSEVIGQLRPATRNGQKGSQFFASEIIFPNGNRQSINANSRIVTKTETISRGADTGQILTDAAIGAGAASVIALLTGNRSIEVLEPVAGGAAGAAASVLLRKKQQQVISIDPQQDLNITLRSNLLVSRSSGFEY
jgi:hypothetical protein